MEKERTVILKTEQHKRVVSALIASTPLPEIEGGECMEVVIRPHEPGHSDAQHRLIWKLLQAISDYITDDNGNKHSAEWWNYKLKCQFGFVAGTIPMTINGLTIDVPMPKSLSKSARGETRMKKGDATAYYQELEVFAAEHDVYLED